MGEMRKVTINLPTELVDGLAEQAGQSLSEAIRTAIRDYRHKLACQRLLAARGTIQFEESYEELVGKYDDEW